MSGVAIRCRFWLMPGYLRISNAGGPRTRIGRLSLAGEVMDAEPVMPRRIRVLDEFVLSVVTQGRGLYREGTTGPAQPIEPGSLTLTMPGQPHWYGTRPGECWTEWFAVFSGVVFDALRGAGVLTGGGPRPLAPGTTATTLAFVLRARPTGQSAAEHQLLTLADWLVSACSPDSESESRWNLAAARLVEDFEAKTRGPQIAAELGLSYDDFRRGFTQVFGQPPHAYRNTRRGEASASMLRLTAMTTREISHRLGYADEFHFSHAFQRQFGTSPSAYRRSTRREPTAGAEGLDAPPTPT